MAKKAKAGIIILAVILVLWTVYGIIHGVRGLSNSSYTDLTINSEMGKLCEADVEYATEAYYVKHTLNVIIPTGTEHFYWCATEDDGVPLLIKARESWYNKNFDEDGWAKRTVKVKGEVMRMDPKFTKDITDLNKKISPLGFSVSSTKYISSTYKTEYGLWLTSGIFNIVVTAAAIVMLKKDVGMKILPIPIVLAVGFMGFVALFAETL